MSSVARLPIQSEPLLEAWFSLQTRYRYEKKVAAQLASKGLEVFLPVRKENREWSDRTKEISVPLFAGYVFVRSSRSLALRLLVLQTPGVMGFVSFAGTAAVVPPKQIEDLRLLLAEKLLRAMQKVPRVPLIIAGDGPQRTELQQLARRLALTNVQFVGHIDSARRDFLIAQSRFTVLPSHAYETLGKTILESYAEGRAVVASDMGSRRELVSSGETGLLYRTGDVHQLVAAIETLGSQPGLAEKMGRAGWERVRDQYAPESHAQKLLSLYQGLIAVKTRRNCTLVATTEEPPWARRRRAFPQNNVAVSQQPKLKVAFIGGRGVVSKYSGIETYYEEVGKRLAQMGHEVTVYCRTYFTPAQAERNGMRLVRLPTIRSKHLETLVHTILSTVHAMTQRYDVVHYHTLGPALFSFFPRLVKAKTTVTVQGLDWQRKKWRRFASAVLRLGERASVQLPNGTMVVSKDLQQRYRKLHGVEAFYVPNGGVLRERSTAAQDTRVGSRSGALRSLPRQILSGEGLPPAGGGF